jgi:hypothetical protein
MQIEVSDVEFGLLQETLRQAHRDLKEEIYKTEAYAYHQHLKEREAMLEGLLHKLGAAAEPEGAEPGSVPRHLEFDVSDVDNKAIGGG